MATELKSMTGVSIPLSEIKGSAFTDKGLQKPSGVVSGIVSNGLLMPVDGNSLTRALLDVTQISLGGIHSPFAGTVGQVLASPGMGVVYQASGAPTAVMGFYQAAQLPTDFNRIAFAQKIGDKRGVVLSGLGAVKNLSGFTACVSLGAGFRSTATLSIIQKVSYSGFNAPTLLGRVTYGFLFVGLTLFTVFFAAITLMGAISIFEGEKLKSKLKGKNPEEQLQLLQNYLKVDSQKLMQKLLKKHGGNLNQALEKEALSVGVSGLRLLVKEAGLPAKSDKELEAVLRKMASESHESIADIGFQLKINELATKKEEKLKRILGGSMIENIKNGIVDSEAVKKAITSNTKINVIGIIVCLIAIASLVAAIVCTGGTGLIIAAVLMLLSSLAQQALDAYCLHQSLKGDGPAPYDKKLVIFSMVTAVAVIVTMVALTALGVVSFGIVPLIIGIVLTTLWVGQGVWTLKVLNEKEEKQKLALLKELNAQKTEEDKIAFALKHFAEVKKAGLDDWVGKATNLRKTKQAALKASLQPYFNRG